MKTAPNSDGVGIWSGAFVLSVGVHAALIAGLMAIDAPQLEKGRGQVAQIEIMVIEQLDFEAPLPAGGADPDAAADALVPEAPDALAEATLPETSTPDALPEPDSPEPELVEVAQPEPLGDTDGPAQRLGAPAPLDQATAPPGTLEEQIQEPEEIALSESAEAPGPPGGPAPERPEAAVPVEEALSDFAPPQPAPVEPDFLAAEESDGIGLVRGLPASVAPSGPPPGLGDEIGETAPPAVGAGPDVGALPAGDLTEAAAPDLPVQETPEEAVPPEDLEIAALPPELLPAEEVPPPAAETPEGPGTSGEGVSDGAPAVRPADAEELRQLRVLVERIRLLSNRPCVIALPRRRAGGAVAVEIIGADAAQMAALQEDIFTDLAVDPAGITRQVSPEQCAALEFVRDAADYPVMRLGIGLAHDPVLADATRPTIEGIGRLQATVIARPGWQVTLLMIDDSGVMQDLTEYLHESDGNRQIDIPVRRSGGPAQTRQILLALASAGPLTDLRAADGLPAGEALATNAGDLRGVPMAVVTVDIR